MRIPDEPPRYRSYLLRFWQERGWLGGQAVWRFSFDDPRTGRRRGFASLDELIVAMQREMAQTEIGQTDVSALFDSMEEYTMRPDPHAEDEAAIRVIVDQIQAGWNANSGQHFAAPFAEDADYVIVDGRYIKGRQIIEQGHQQIFDTIYSGSSNSATVRSVRFLRVDVAVVHVEWHLRFQQGDAARQAKAINTMVMIKDSGMWAIAAFHNTPIASFGA